jgi:hypothetical protein
MKDVPTPWWVTANSWQYTTIYDANGDTICRLNLDDWGVTEEIQDVLEKRQSEVAKLIVDSVNLRPSREQIAYVIREKKQGFDIPQDLALEMADAILSLNTSCK